MKILFRIKNRISITLILLFLAILSGAFYYVHQNLVTLNPPPEIARTNLMAITGPLVPIIPQPKPPAPITRDVLIQRNETFGQLMEQQGFEPDVIRDVYETAKPYYNLAQIHAGRNIEITTDPGQNFLKLRYEIDPLQLLIVSRETGGELTANIESHEITTTVKELGGYIEGSLYNTMDRLGEGDELVIHFAEIFEWDVDFFKDLQAGDSFRIVYEKQSVQNQPYGYGHILAAELVNKGKVYKAIGYQNGNNWEFFSTDGQPMKKAFLASPLKFSRITSGFSAHRYHPLLHMYRPHYGTDYAAPVGTPVRAIGRGNVIFAGWAGGAGRTIKLQHDHSIQTFYCHLSRFGSGIRKGASVSQGQVIGYVGSTGLSTGPHLDFRFLQSGRYVNFLKIKSPQADPLTDGELVKFRAASGTVIDRLETVKLMRASETVYASKNGVRLSEGTY